MENKEVATQEEGKALTTKALFTSENIKKKFEEMMGRKAQGFITSVLQICASNKLLATAEPMSVYNAACMAAVLDLPLNNNLGFAYIIPYNEKYSSFDAKGKETWHTKQVAQFQLGYKGYIQLAMRTGKYKTIAATPIYEGQLVSQNPLTGFVFDFEKKVSETIIGFASYFSLVNGFEKTLFMTTEQMKAHGLKYSKTFNNKNGRWTLDFEGMGNKTVLKLLLSKYGMLSIEMERALVVDQAVINDENGESVTYADVVETTEDVQETELEQIQSLWELKKESKELNDMEKSRIAEVIEKKEVASYAKILTLLKSK